MTVGVVSINNDVQSRNKDLLATALGLAQNIYKVKMDEKQFNAAKQISQGEKQAALDAKSQEQAVNFAKDFEIVPPDARGAIEPAKAGLALPQGLSIPDGMAIRPRTVSENEARIAAAQQDKEADRASRLEMAKLTAATKENGKQASESERLTALYGKRLEQANDKLSQLETDPNISVTGPSQYLQTWLPDSLRSKDSQMLSQAQRNFITAALRKESGASISPTEFSTAAEQYFAQPGDAPEVVAQKRANRDLVIQGFQVAAGKGYDNLDSAIAAGPKNQRASEKVEIPGVGVTTKDEIVQELLRRQQKNKTAGN